MDGLRFDHLARALSEAGTRRGLLGLLTALPILGGLFALLDPDETDAKGRRNRRKKRHKHGKGNGRRRKRKYKKQKCKAKSRAKTCNGKCGPVKNNCGKTVDCGPCTCEPPCGTCETCSDDLVCAPCSPCCDEVCCAQANAVCHADSGACCVPDAHAQTCDGQCGEVRNNCGILEDCGPCTCGVGCAFCRICDEATGECVPDPHDVGEPCGPARCAAGIATAAPTCDASGACQPGAQEGCAPYVCDGDACARTCGTTDDCIDGYFCDATDHCVAQGDQGDACAADAQCQTGFCVDDVCCNTACDGACEACNLSGQEGICKVEADGATCGGGNVCCAGACQGCCDSGDCSGTTPVCVSNTCQPCNSDPTACPGDTCCDTDNGRCVATCPASDPVCAADNVCKLCSEFRPCPSGQVCCGGSCFSGICCDGAACPDAAAPDCVGHDCVCAANNDTACAPGETCCTGGCADLDSDPNHCSDCLTTCSNPTPACDGGHCVRLCSATDPCPTGQCCTANGSCGACLVFVTSTTSNGNLGGLDGAHQRCQLLAEAASLPGAYKAWLSDEGVAAPVNFFTRATVPYQLRNGTIIANNWANLTDGTLAAPIDRDENGNAVAVSHVWTNTRANGTVSGIGDCQDWQGTSGSTHYGKTDEVDFTWSRFEFRECADVNRRLYCFQQT